MPNPLRHIVLAPIGSRGDVQPMLALALGLRARGHEITLAAPEDFSGWIASYGLRFVPVGGNLQADLRREGDRLHGSWRQTRFMRDQVVPRQFENLAHVCRGADLIVGAGLQVAAPSVAERSGIPYVFVAYAPPAIQSAFHPPPVIRHQSLPRPVNRVLWGAFDAVLSLALAGPINRGRRAMGLPPIHDVAAYLTRSPMILASDPALTGPVPDVDSRVHRVAALRYEDPAPLPPAVSDFLNAGPPPVLVGFGSMVTDRAREVAALLARAAELAGLRLVIQSGWTGLTGDGGPSSMCLFTGALPHRALLPLVAGVVHHGGAGTTASAARAARPQLILPYLLDQFYWAHRVRKLGLGPQGLPIGRVRDAGRLAALLADLVVNARYREAAAAVARRLTGDGVDVTAAILEQV